MNKKILIASLLATTFPFFAFATTSTLKDLIKLLAGYMNSALALLMGFAVLVFVYYIIKYFIIASDSSTDRTEAGKYVMYSILGFFIILSMWGLVNILSNTFDLGQNTPGSWTSLKNLFPQ